jgi:hypothetical protein
MKKALLHIFLALLLALNAQAANYYFDLASGNDTSGDGTYGNPWKTIDKCTTSRSAGDECRGAKTTITTLSGTLTFTNGSTSVATSSDQTAVVAAGDLVGKNSGLEGWWKVASLNTTTITLTSQYWGLSGSGSAVTGYKITPITASEEYDVNSSGSSGSYIKVSGGWNLVNQTQEGITALSSGYNSGIDLSGKNWVELEKFIVSSPSLYGLNLGSTTYNVYVHDCWLAEAPYYALQLGGSSYSSTIKNVVATGGAGSQFYLSGGNHTFESVYSFTAGTGAGDYGFETSSVACTLKDVRAYNSYAANFSFGGESFANFIIDLIASTNRSATYCVTLATASGENRFFNPDISSCQYGLGASSHSTNNFFIGGSITGTSTEYQTSSNGQSALAPVFIIQESGTDSRMIWNDGVVEHDSSAECRSGKCLKFTSTSASYPLIYKVGNVKIPSASSDLTLKAYLKDDSSFNGSVNYFVSRNGKFISKTEKTPTTSWVQNTVVVSAADLTADEYLDLFVIVGATAGNVYIDDFSAEQ